MKLDPATMVRFWDRSIPEDPVCVSAQGAGSRFMITLGEDEEDDDGPYFTMTPEQATGLIVALQVWLGQK